MPYPTVAELRSHIGVEASDTTEDGRLASALTAAVADVEAFSGRKFTQDSVVSARTFRPVDGWCLRLPAGHDISTTTGLVIETDDSGVGTYGTTWAATDYVLEPFDGVGYDGQPGWPYNVIHSVGTRLWYPYRGRATVRITAQWGWAAVPQAVFEAVVLHAAELWKQKDAPFGMLGGALLGTARVQANPMVASLLARYQHGMVGAVIA